AQTAPLGAVGLTVSRILGIVRGPIIDGEQWIAARLEFLRERLAGALPEDERKVIEDEIEVLSHEVGLTVGGFPSPRFLGRWLRRLRKEK
ncbi:MAG: hypothetical protein LC792_21585, partial [Actinobacteria bacterium]|nr:hypothetical protein [Actinomycetota bacterium]